MQQQLRKLSSQLQNQEQQASRREQELANKRQRLAAKAAGQLSDAEGRATGQQLQQLSVRCAAHRPGPLWAVKSRINGLVSAAAPFDATAACAPHMQVFKWRDAAAQLGKGRLSSVEAFKGRLQEGGAAGAATAWQQVLGQVGAAVSSILGRAVQPDEPLVSAGLDSLGSVELRNSLQGQLDLELPATLVFDYPSVAAIAGFIGGRLPAFAAAGPAAAAAGEEEEEEEGGYLSGAECEYAASELSFGGPAARAAAPARVAAVMAVARRPNNSSAAALACLPRLQAPAWATPSRWAPPPACP
jgi:acyl carrier protein